MISLALSPTAKCYTPGAFDPLPIVLVLAHSDSAALQIQAGERMVTPESMISVAAQHALQDMVELQMYLVTQAQETPWQVLPRRSKRQYDAREPYSNVVQSRVAKELVKQGFIEGSSSRTFVVSKSGYQFYEREIKPHSSSIHKSRE
jgi:hypothetical protein